MFPMTPWVKRLLIANVVVFFPTMAIQELYLLLLLYPPAVLVRPWTIVTYMFLHGGFAHLLFNMIGLFFFGPRLESRLGSGGFLWLYFLSGIGGAAFSFVFARQYPVVGASAASVVGSSNLITKVYFPRMVIPGASALAALVDFVVAFAVLLVLLALYHFHSALDYEFSLRWSFLLLPFFVLMAMATALGVGLWLADGLMVPGSTHGVDSDVAGPAGAPDS